MKVLAPDRFVKLLATEFELDPVCLVRATRFVGDLDFDSFQFFRLAVFIEMLAPIDVPDDVDLDALTVGALYDFYAVEAALI
jgi:acyl carrier protein